MLNFTPRISTQYRPIIYRYFTNIPNVRPTWFRTLMIIDLYLILFGYINIRTDLFLTL